MRSTASMLNRDLADQVFSWKGFLNLCESP